MKSIQLMKNKTNEISIIIVNGSIHFSKWEEKKHIDDENEIGNKCGEDGLEEKKTVLR